MKKLALIAFALLAVFPTARAQEITMGIPYHGRNYFTPTLPLQTWECSSTQLGLSNQVEWLDVDGSVTTYVDCHGVLHGGGTDTCTEHLTTEGDLLYYHDGACARLPIGSSNQILTVNAGDPAWETPATPPSSNGICSGNYLDVSYCRTPLPGYLTNAVNVIQSNSAGIVQASNANLPSPTSQPVSFPGNTISGDQIVVLIMENTSAVLPDNSFAVTDSQGNTFTQANCSQVADITHGCVYTATTSQSAADTVTVVYTATGGSPAQNLDVYILEVQNLGTYEQAAIGGLTTSGSVSITTTHSNDTVFGIAGGVSASSAYNFSLVSSGWESIPTTLLLTASGSNHFGMATSALNAPTAGAYSLNLNVSGILGDAAQASVILWSFQNASSEGGSGLMLPRLGPSWGQQPTYYFAQLATLQNGFTGTCADCDPPTFQGATCTSSGAKTGAYFVTVQGGAACFGLNLTGGGSVSSVGLSLPGMFTVSGSPVTSTGTLTASLANQSGPAWFGQPASGSATPGFESSALPLALLPGSGVTTINGVGCTIGSSCAPPTSVPVVIATSSNSTIGLWNFTYTSGGTLTCTIGQTITLSSFNGGGSSATGTLACTGSNTIAASTTGIVTAQGTGFTSAPTSATCGSGTGTCTGTITLASTLVAIFSDPGGSAYWLECGYSGGACSFTPPAGTATTTTQRWYSNQASITSQIVVNMPSANTLDVNGSNGSAGGCAYSGGALADGGVIASDAANHYKLVGQGATTWTANSGSACL